MRIIETKAYQFDELSGEAKERAIENCRETEFYQSGEYFKSIKKGLDMFGLFLKDWSIDFDNINCSSWKINLDRLEDYHLELSGQRLRTYLINNIDEFLTERKHWGKYEKRTNGKWAYDRYSKIQRTESYCPFTGCMTDECFLDVFRDFVKKPNNSTLEDLITNAVHNTFKAACDEWEHMQGEEYTIEMIEANGYEFTADGELI